ncbi:hypothetical protein [Carbonactinospora thermoautotrophica]|uniref:hypothetical protein n=1 Tax=Carbonactinospora thermoautotrophica TaxID=1469144 RepID=UPI000AE3F324|nr:hypothetical protein [Carbonactinospora thermoautotrophica]
MTSPPRGTPAAGRAARRRLRSETRPASAAGRVHDDEAGGGQFGQDLGRVETERRACA